VVESKLSRSRLQATARLGTRPPARLSATPLGVGEAVGVTVGEAMGENGRCCQRGLRRRSDRGDGAGDEVMALEMLVFYLLSLFILFLYAILTFTFVVGVTTRRNVCVDASIRQREHRRSHLTETTSPTTPTYFFTLRRIPSMVEVTTRRNARVDDSIPQ